MQKLKWENIHGEIFGLTFCDYAKSFCDLMNEYAKDCLSKWPSSDVSIRLHFLFDYKTSTENNFNDFYVLNKMTSECNNMGDCAIAISLHDKGFSINHEAELIIENLDKIPQKLSHAALADDKYFGCYIEFKNFDVPDQIKKIFNLFNEQLLPIFCSGFSGGPLEDVINYMLSLGLSDRTVPNLLRGNRENLYRSVNKEFIARYFLLDSDYLNTLSSMKYEHGANKGCVVIQSQDEYVLNHQQEFLDRKISFDPPFAFVDEQETRGIRKCIESSRKEFPLIIDIQRNSSGKLVNPVINVLGYADENQCKSRNLIIFHGQMHWQLSLGEYCLEANEWTCRLSLLEKPGFTSHNKFLKNVERIIQLTRKVAGHGAVIVFGKTEGITQEVERLSALKRGRKIKPVFLKSNDKKNPILDTDYRLILESLCAVDGALFMDYDGTCYGYGFIMDGKAIKKGTPSRGSRYNSTKTYIENVMESMKDFEFRGVVFSEDGGIDVFPPDVDFVGH